MKTLDAETGLSFLLFPTEAMSADLARFRESECKHSHKALCKFIDGGGRPHIRLQCQTCGAKIGTAVSKAAAAALEIVDFVPDLQTQYQTAREQEYQSILQKHVELQKALSGSKSKRYVEHLTSTKWQHIRQKVLKRANRICEGCLENPATQVHHKHYEDLGNELMFDLLALCESCHNRLHPNDDDGEDIESRIARLECQCRWTDGDLFNPQCMKFGTSVSEAIAEDGGCGPDRDGHEEYK